MTYWVSKPNEHTAKVIEVKGVVNTVNTPNKLTVLRIFLAPIFLALLVFHFSHHYLAALIVFIIASLTDLIDGMLARKHNLITDFGKFLDPLADKMLTTAAFLGFIALNIGAGMVWITFIVLTREFLITSLRLLAANGGKVVAANIWGKAKTVSQMTAIIMTLLSEYIISLNAMPIAAVSPVRYVCVAVLWVSAVLTVVSGITYLLDNRKFINHKK